MLDESLGDEEEPLHPLLLLSESLEPGSPEPEELLLHESPDPSELPPLSQPSLAALATSLAPAAVATTVDAVGSLPGSDEGEPPLDPPAPLSFDGPAEAVVEMTPELGGEGQPVLYVVAVTTGPYGVTYCPGTTSPSAPVESGAMRVSMRVIHVLPGDRPDSAIAASSEMPPHRNGSGAISPWATDSMQVERPTRARAPAGHAAATLDEALAQDAASCAHRPGDPLASPYAAASEK